MSSQKYNFDYYTERLAILSEMARPSPWAVMGEVGNRLKTLFDYSSKVISKGGTINIQGKEMEVVGYGGNRGTATNLLFTVYSLINDNVTLEEELASTDKEEDDPVNLTWKCCDILGIPDLQYRQYGLSDVDKLYRATIKKLIELKPEYILSDEYKDKVTNHENILRFSRTNRHRTNTAKAIASSRAEKFGFDEKTPLEKVDEIQSRTGISDIIAAIKKEQANRKRKFVHKQKKGINTSDIENSQQTEETGDKYIDNVYMVLDALEILIDRSNNIKKDINFKFNSIPKEKLKMLSGDNIQNILEDFIEELSDNYHNFPVKFLKTLYVRPTSFYEELTNNFQELLETGISISDFYELMDTLRQKHTSTKGVNTLIDALIYEVNELMKIMGDLSRVETDKYDPYKNIDNDILQKYIPSPEIGEKVKEFFDLEKRQHQITLNNIKRRMLSSDIKQASDEFLIQRELAELQRKIGDAESQIKNIQPESYVMSYMTEQVSKDKFKPRGEFKDRGFKKMNYLQWIERNQ